MEDKSLLEELQLRAQMIVRRHELGKTDPAMREQAKRDEQQLLDDTASLDEHPDDYDGPCSCKTCMSYD